MHDDVDVSHDLGGGHSHLPVTAFIICVAEGQVRHTDSVVHVAQDVWHGWQINEESK